MALGKNITVGPKGMLVVSRREFLAAVNIHVGSGAQLIVLDEEDHAEFLAQAAEAWAEALAARV